MTNRGKKAFFISSEVKDDSHIFLESSSSMSLEGKVALIFSGGKTLGAGNLM